MKKIYIVLTHTGTLLSRLIKNYTRAEFSHVSIALDIELKEMYSFGRLHPYNAFIGGFVHEYVNQGTFKRFYNTTTKIYSLDVTDNQYCMLRNIIDKFESKKKDYKFNFCGLCAAGFNRRIERKKAFYCAEFVKYLMENASINLRFPYVVKPEDFKNMVELQEIYYGLLREYQVPTEQYMAKIS